MKGKTVVFTANKVQKELCRQLKEKGLDAVGVDRLPEAYPKEFLKAFDNIIFPFPSKENNLGFIPKGADLSEIISPHQLVIGGMISEAVRQRLEKAGARYDDYFENEAYVLKNAYITSLGTLRLLLTSTEDYIVGKRVLVSGFGRIGKALAGMLRGLGVKVFVAARSEAARAQAVACGYEAFSFSQLKATLFYYDYIFNTVPVRLFSECDIRHIRDDALYFELASSPFGADERDFAANGKTFVHGNALPGRYFPSAVAKNICDYIFSSGGE